MAIDNRTEINDCEGPTNEFDGSDVGSVDTEIFYEGSSTISAQFSNTQEFLIAHQNSAGTNLNLDLSDATVWLIIKDNLVVTEALDGMQIVLGDGDANNDNNQGYVIGGSDNPGLVLGNQFYCLRLDVSNRTGLTVIQHRSNGAPTFTAIGSVGYGALHAIAARGNVDNLFLDRMTFINNGSYAFTINAGTSGTPITLDTLVSQDRDPTNGWGLFTQGVGQSFTLFASMEWGTPTGTADSYFSQSDSQIYLDGQQVGTGHFIFRTIGNATGTNSFVLDNCVLVSSGEPAIWDYTDTNMNIIDIQSSQYIDMGTISWPVTGGTTRQVLSSTFINCGQIDFSTITATNCSIIGSRNANGAILLDADGNSTNQTGLTFTSDGTGHGVEITAAGSYTFNNWEFSGYSTASPGTNSTPSSGSTDAMVFNNSGGAVTITVSGGTNVTVRNAASSTTTVINNATVSLTRLLGNTEISVLENPSPYSATSLPAPAVTTVASTERVSADTITGNGSSDYVLYTNNSGFLQINAIGLGANFTNFPGVLQDTNASNPRNLAAGDRVRVTIRDDADNPSLQLFDEFEVSGTPTASAVLTTTSFSGFTSAFGTTLNSANSKTVTVEKVDARFQFSTPVGNVIDILAFRTGSDPVLSLENTAETGNLPLSQTGDRNYRDPA